MKLKIDGELASKSNSRRLVGRNTGNPRIIKSKKALEYEEQALWQLKSQWGRKKPLGKGIGLDVDVFYKSRRPDLDVALLMDVLEKGGVIENDRYIVEINARKHLDKENPRVELDLYDMDYI